MSSLVRLTKEQLAARLGVSARQLDYFVSRNELPTGERIGRRVLWLEDVAEAWEKRRFAEQLAWAQGFR